MLGNASRVSETGKVSQQTRQVNAEAGKGKVPKGENEEKDSPNLLQEEETTSQPAGRLRVFGDAIGLFPPWALPRFHLFGWLVGFWWAPLLQVGFHRKEKESQNEATPHAVGLVLWVLFGLGFQGTPKGQPTDMAVVKPMGSHFGVGEFATHVGAYFSGWIESDVHWGVQFGC